MGKSRNKHCFIESNDAKTDEDGNDLDGIDAGTWHYVVGERGIDNSEL